jgi:hypothetical protein
MWKEILCKNIILLITNNKYLKDCEIIENTIILNTLCNNRMFEKLPLSNIINEPTLSTDKYINKTNDTNKTIYQYPAK